MNEVKPTKWELEALEFSLTWKSRDTDTVRLNKSTLAIKKSEKWKFYKEEKQNEKI